MAKFDYSAYFAPITPLADLLRESPTRFWEPTREDLARPHDYVLYLGCNVLRTVHLAEAIVAVLNTLGADFVTMGGPSSCCGVIHHRAGDAEASAGVSQHTMDKFTAVRPQAVLMYCPSCHSHFDSELPKGELDFDVPYFHVTEFIAQRLAQLEFRKRVPRRVALHAHEGFDQQRADVTHTRAILRAIPGLDLVDLPVDAAWGKACTPFQVQAVGKDPFRARVTDHFGAAQSLGCDALAAVYHSCYRELLPREQDLGLEVVNYVELLAEALGLGPFTPRYKALKLAGDPEAARAELAPRAAERGIGPERLRRAVDAHFAPDAPMPGTLAKVP